GIIVCSAKDGLTVGTEKAWKYLSDNDLPKAIYISRIDEENGDFETAYNAIREKYGSSVCPVIVPIKNDAGRVEGIVDLIHKKAYRYENNKQIEILIPDAMAGELEDLYMAVNEAVAETSEELMEKYFDGQEFTIE